MGVAAVVALGGLLVTALYRGNALQESRAASLSFTSSSSIPLSENDVFTQQELLLLGLSDDADAPSAARDSASIIGPIVVAQLVGGYAGLEDSGLLSEQTLAATADTVAKNLRAAVSYRTYTSADIKVRDDVSPEAVLLYRSEMRDALLPLLDNAQNELDLYGAYLDTGEGSHLDLLRDAAARYRSAEASAAALITPRDALIYHRDVLNALGGFAAVIEEMAAHADSALAAAALLRTYNEKEAAMYTAFNALSAYYVRKAS